MPAYILSIPLICRGRRARAPEPLSSASRKDYSGQFGRVKVDLPISQSCQSAATPGAI
jgi:hypothetical protein